MSTSIIVLPQRGVSVAHFWFERESKANESQNLLPCSKGFFFVAVYLLAVSWFYGKRGGKEFDSDEGEFAFFHLS